MKFYVNYVQSPNIFGDDGIVLQKKNVKKKIPTCPAYFFSNIYS